MQRLILYYGFRGYPMRKDFPLSGFSELYFDNARSKITSYEMDMVQILEDRKQSEKRWRSGREWHFIYQ